MARGNRGGAGGGDSGRREHVSRVKKIRIHFGHKSHEKRACVLERSDPETHGRAARVHYESGHTRSPANACVC